MSGFLDQDEIDKLQLELAIVTEKKEKSMSAKAKIRVKYAELVRYSCQNDMNTIDEIGTVINDINMRITPSSQYNESFDMLKSSFTRRL